MFDGNLELNKLFKITNVDNLVEEEIVNVERGKIFERYGDFTDELENYLYYGEYPGREVTNKELTDKLERLDFDKEFKPTYIVFSMILEELQN